MASGSRSVVTEAIGWIAGLGICAFGFAHYHDIKTVLVDKLLQPGATGDVAAIVVDRGERRNAGAEIFMSRDGHFHADAEINGRSVSVMVDTGATMVALTHEDAERAGIRVRDTDFTHRVSTANGTARIAPVMIDRVTIGAITVRNVRGAVSEPGRLSQTLLGMTFLGRLSRAEIRSGVLLLEE